MEYEKKIQGEAIIIGSGFIARNFQKRIKDTDIVIFASGVSNSSCTDKKQYNKEMKKLLNIVKQFPNKKLVYFSTCSVADKSRSKNMYQLHKKKIEKYICENLNKYLIFRLPEIVGNNKNKYTLTNFLYTNIKLKKSINTSLDVYRNLMDIEDVKKVVMYFINLKVINRIISIANTNMYSSMEIMKIFEKILRKKAIIFEKNDLDNIEFNINTKKLRNVYKKLNINFENNYLLKTLKKYYK